MAPIEETFAKEYPDYDPFPFGQESWITTLVRNILLAEPMVEEFGRCFTDVTSAATARDLAGSFRLENCVVRERLARCAVRVRGSASGRRGRSARSGRRCRRSARRGRAGR